VQEHLKQESEWCYLFIGIEEPWKSSSSSSAVIFRGGRVSKERGFFAGRQIHGVLPFCRNNPEVKNMQISEFPSLEQSVRITARLALRGDGKLLEGF